jgi:mono/diheme cytochrome c family protein
MGTLNRYVLAAAVLFAGATIDAVAFGQGASGKTVWDGIYADAQSKRGEEVSKTSCVTCHGDGLAGSDLAPALQGDDFRAAWAGRSVGELFEKVQTTMPADNAGTLKPQQSADVLAYMLKINEYPTGTSELATEMAALQQIKITGKK